MTYDLLPVTCVAPRYHVLQIDGADSFSDLGGMSVTLTVLLALAWLILFYSLRKGVESSGKVK